MTGTHSAPITWHELPAEPWRARLPGRLQRLANPQDALAAWQEYLTTGPWIDPHPIVVQGVRGHQVSFLAPVAPRPTALVLHTLTDRHRNDLRPTLLTELPGTGLQAISLHLPAGLVCSYGLVDLPEGMDPGALDRDGWRRVVRAIRPDEAGVERIGHPTGELSRLALPGGRSLTDWEPPAQSGMPRGRTVRFEVPDVDRQASVEVWAHQSAPEHGPSQALLVLLDGDTWVKHLGVTDLLDRAVAAGALPPMTTLLPSSGKDRDARLGLHDDWADWLAVDLVERARQHVDVVEDPTRSIVAGQSLGGAAALHTALHHPERFGCVVPQSGAFWWPAVDGVDQFALRGMVATHTGPRLRVAHQIGTLEFHLLDLNRDLVRLLDEAGHRVVSHEDVGGHDGAIWHPGLVRALAHLL